jgi:hypothetical protein
MAATPSVQRKARQEGERATSTEVVRRLCVYPAIGYTTRRLIHPSTTSINLAAVRCTNPFSVRLVQNITRPGRFHPGLIGVQLGTQALTRSTEA